MSLYEAQGSWDCEGCLPCIRYMSCKRSPAGRVFAGHGITRRRVIVKNEAIIRPSGGGATTPVQLAERNTGFARRFADSSPGGRPPHMWLEDGRSLYDMFHTEWTLLALGPRPAATERFEQSAQALGIDLRVVRLPQQSPLVLYEQSLVLIRPDQIVAWRGGNARYAAEVLARVTGRRGAQLQA